MIVITTKAGIQRRNFNIPGFYTKFCVKLAHQTKEKKIMSEQVEKISEEDNEPIYYKPKTLNLIASISGILSWVVLVGFLVNIGVQAWGMQASIAQAVAQGQPFDLATLLKEPSFHSFLFTAFITPLLTGLTMFMTLQGISLGLNVLLEIDFNARDPKE
jgi:hypothetical protein